MKQRKQYNIRSEDRSTVPVVVLGEKQVCGLHCFLHFSENRIDDMQPIGRFTVSEYNTGMSIATASTGRAAFDLAADKLISIIDVPALLEKNLAVNHRVNPEKQHD